MLSKKGSRVKGQGSSGERKGTLFIVSAPSGTGKTTLCKMAVDFFPDLRHSTSYTTRPHREGEKNGSDYNFVSNETFNKMLKNGEFLEWAEVHGQRYGTSMYDLNALLKEGVGAVLDIDVQGARQLKDNPKGLDLKKVFIFIMPPSIEVCEERLKSRAKDDKASIARRLENAKNEIRESVWYDYKIVNENLDTAFERLKSIIIKEKA